jgi:N-acetylglucosamine kinase-like BadF-type ATPase
LALRNAQLVNQSFTSACLALAGADRPVEQRNFRAWAEARQLANQVTITNDALPVLYAGAVDGVGIALISGTGSVAVARNSAGETARCGGWGSLLGDEGSGYQIAVSGLKAAARAADGRGPETGLLPQILSHFQLSDASELIPAIYATQIDRSRIAKLAPTIFAVADSGDAVAKSIITQAAADLTELVITLATRLRLTHSAIPLAISGGVLLSQPTLVDEVRRRLAAAPLPDVIVTPVPDPVAGAIKIAISNTK